ncbi:hypothetical protein CU254_11960 [Amycolatopsis sp. AA4]|uniref:hypothetical protein n=1 Tax=Actinomycetes TaxID=1760 RepID=UPI0001B55001|nr:MULTISPECIES: hypothetical protein [Actinomycetes]ATY11104.1 hypothetical protein CU254_11960 [Amycolatopsis sp. AA4]EFL06670.1 predicted protein [Streptomyces sp. AA4]
MTNHGEPASGEEWVVVRRPGIVRLADSALRARIASARARRRGDTMIGLVATAARAGANAKVHSHEPDGAKWTVTVIAKGTAR